MKRTLVKIEDVACWDHLHWAFWRAALGKRQRPEVQRFQDNLSNELSRLQRQILGGQLELQPAHSFEIRDPKRRQIQAPRFRERVLHHALMAKLGPIIERSLIDDSYACRIGKGTTAVVARARAHSRKHPWYLKLDICAYFGSIDHGTLKRQLRRRIQGSAVLGLCDQILDFHTASPGKGLPIGALTSQWFANLYLADLDRLLLEHPKVGGYVRYMDDMVLWGASAEVLRALRGEAEAFAGERLHLEIKPNWKLQKSRRGVPLCGFVLHPHRLAASKRRKHRYRQARQSWEEAFREGRLDAAGLQTGYDAALSILASTDSTSWRRRDLDLRPPVEA